MGTPSSSPSQSVSQSSSSSLSASASVTPSASPSAERGDEQVVTLEEAKEVLHVSGSDHDFRIDSLIDAAAELFSERQRRKYITETVVEYFDRWPKAIRTRWSPLIAVTSLRYIDSAGSWQTLDPAAYIVDATSEPGRIVESYGYSWPGVRGDANGIELTYTAGYGSSADDVPSRIRTAILQMVFFWFYNPAHEGQLPASVMSLVDFDALKGV